MGYQKIFRSVCK